MPMEDKKYIALESTSQEIKTAVEVVQSDVDTMQTDVTEVKGNVSELKTTDVPNIDTLVDAVLERIGLTTDTGGSTNLGSLMAKANAILTQLQTSGGGGIKKVQRGMVANEECNDVDRSFLNTYYMFVNIPEAINPSKSFLIIQDNNSPDPNFEQGNCAGKIYSSTQLMLYANYENRNGAGFVRKVLWEVVEFN